MSWGFRRFGRVIYTVLHMCAFPSRRQRGLIPSWLLLSRDVPGVYAVELGAIVLPENHRRRWKLVHHVSSKFVHIKQLAAYMNLATSERLTVLQDLLTPALLCFFAQRGDMRALDALIAQGADVDATDYDGRSAAHLAAAEGHSALLHYLIHTHGASVTLRDAKGGTCFNDAVRSRDERCIALVRPSSKVQAARRRFSFRRSSGGHRNPREAHEGAAKASRRQRPPPPVDVEQQLGTAEGHVARGSVGTAGTALHADIGSHLCILAACGDTAELVTIVRAGVSVNATDYDGRTALHIAASNHDRETCAALLSLGASNALKDAFGSTAAEDAEKAGFSELAADIRKANRSTVASAPHTADRDAMAVDPRPPRSKRSWWRTPGSRTPAIAADDDALLGLVVCAAVHNGDVLLVRELTARLPANQFTNLRDYDRRTPMHVAAERADEEMVRMLLSTGTTLSAPDRWGHTPIVCAALQKATTVLQLLRVAGAEVGLADLRLALLLCNAAHSLDHELLKHLLMTGCKADVQDYDGRSAVHIAAQHGDRVAYVMLTEAGGSPDLQDRWGQTAAGILQARVSEVGV
jgi:ankyrin repeat protein